jgi:hypothetical protein
VRFSWRIDPKLILAGILGSLTLIVWVGPNTLAHNTPQEPALQSSAPAEKSVPRPEEPRTTKPAEFAKPESSATQAKEDAVPIIPPPVEIVSGHPSEAPGASDDPEKSALAFLEQNRKVAQDQLKGLKDEAEKLRSRLQKVEAGIKRWESLLEALKRSEDGGAAKAWGHPGTSDLEAIPKDAASSRTRRSSKPKPPVEPENTDLPSPSALTPR